MTTIERSAPAWFSARVLLEPARVLLIAAVTGFVFGIGDLWAKANLEPAQAAIIDSSRGWAGAALLLGFLLRTRPGYAAIAGAVMMLVAVEAYYIYENGFRPDLSAWDSESAQYWAVIGVPAGVVFGTVGSWARIGAENLRELLR